MEKKYHFTYQTKNLINGKTYIGVHSTNKVEDKYIGCGIYRQSDAVREVRRYTDKSRKYSFIGAVKKHGYENFKREILSFFNSREEAYEEEKWLVNKEWIQNKSNYNICIGGDMVHIMSGKYSPQYKGDIFIIDKNTGNTIGVYATATQIKLNLGLNQSKISKTLKGQSSGIRDLFFTRNPNEWKKELEDTLDLFRKNRLNVKGKAVIAFNKEFLSIRSASTFFGKGKNGTSYLDDVIDKFRKGNGLPLTAWGYHWKTKVKMKRDENK